MRKMLIPFVALMTVAAPVYSVEVERETEVEQDTEIDEEEIETERSVETEIEDEDFDGTTAYRSRRERVEGPGAAPGSTVRQETEETVVED